MILLDFLLSLTPAAKEKWSVFKMPNRAVQYAVNLEPNDVMTLALSLLVLLLTLFRRRGV